MRIYLTFLSDPIEKTVNYLAEDYSVTYELREWTKDMFILGSNSGPQIFIRQVKATNEYPRGIRIEVVSVRGDILHESFYPKHRFN